MTPSLCSQIFELEQTFFATLSPAQIKDLACNGSLETRDSHLYGELAFLASGLKPCVLVCFPDPELNRLYTEQVIKKTLENSRQFRCCSIQRDIVSDEMNLRGTVMVINQDDPLASQFVKLLEDETCNDISEKELASFLDYPGSLPSSADELTSMLEVAYVDATRQVRCYDDQSESILLTLSIRSSDDPVVVTTFAAQEREIDHINQHFQKYRSKMSEINMDLQIVIRQPANA